MKEHKVDKWRWFGHAGHFICAQWCRFHLCTLVGDHLVSTVGEYWPERPVREIHAKVHDPVWLQENKHLRGDYFDGAYKKRFGFEEIGCDRTYETMVFKAGEPCSGKDCGCGLPETDGSELDFEGYTSAASASAGHLAMCFKYAGVTP